MVVTGTWTKVAGEDGDDTHDDNDDESAMSFHFLTAVNA